MIELIIIIVLLTVWIVLVHKQEQVIVNFNTPKLDYVREEHKKGRSAFFGFFNQYYAIKYKKQFEKEYEVFFYRESYNMWILEILKK